MEKGTKERSWKKDVIRILIALAALAVVFLLAVFLGVFNGFEEALGMLQGWKDKAFRFLLMVVFLFAAENLLLMLLKLLKGKKKGRISTFSTVGTSLVKYAIILIGFCWGLSIIGVNVSTIFASIGVVALILGFGAESLVADLVTGIFILFENQYNVGDIIDVDGFRGSVVEIGIRTISVMDTGGNIKIINNSDLKNIVNRSNQQSVALCDVAVTYEEDLEKLEEKFPAMLGAIQKKHGDLFEKGIEYLGVEELADSGVVLRFKVAVKEEDIFRGRRTLNREIRVAFAHEKIAIPFPQLDVHTK